LSDGVAERLGALGFSTYEARAYEGLLRHGPQTGYALSNATGVPQPKIYEALRRLHERRAVLLVEERPARYAAVPAETLLDELEARFEERLARARESLATLSGSEGREWHEPLLRADGADTIHERAAAALASAEHKVFVSGWERELARLREPIEQADARGVELVVLHFGGLPLGLANGHAYRHASSEGALYPSHRARHLALVVDSRSTLWALAPDGAAWSAFASEDPLVVAAVKDFVRHDIYVQKIYARLAPELHALFGPGLEYLTNLSVDEVLRPAGRKRARG
jgi:sugar-specific transcriptional regulator TrmB